MPLQICRYFRQLMSIAIVVICAQGLGAAVIEISSFDKICLIGVDEGYPLDGDYRLVADIDASGSRGLNDGAGFLPIGRRRVVVPSTEFGVPDVVDTAKAFTGTFDGGGHKISGLYIRRTASDAAGSGTNIGLFGFALGARISNVTVAVDTVAGYRYVGGLAGRVRGGVIEGCVGAGAVVGEADAGGLVGMLEGGGVIRACYSAANVGGESVSDMGGLAGSADGAEIAESYAIGSVSVVSGRDVGGLVGSLVNIARVRSCYSVAAVSLASGDVSEVGGLVGRNDGRVLQSYSAGSVSGGAELGGDVGGLIGAQGDGVGTTMFSFWDTERSGLDRSAGGATGAEGRTTAEMMNAAVVRNLVSADTASWGISNNYPYLKNKLLPRHTLTFTATQGGALSGVTSAGGTVHTQTVNIWISGSAVVAMPSPDSIVGGFDGWYLDGSGTALAAGRYDGFDAAQVSNDGLTGTFSPAGLTAENVAIEARFVLKVYTLKYIAMSGRGKILSRDGNLGEYTADTLVKMVRHGAVSSVAAVPNLGRLFLEWTDNWTGQKLKDSTRTDTALGDITFRAYFIADTVVLKYAAGPGGRLRVGSSSSGVATHTARPLYGANGPLIEAIPNLHYRFVTWDDGVADNPRLDSAATENVDATAIFSNTYEVTYIAGAGGKVAVRAVGADTLSEPVDTAVVTVTVSSPVTPAATVVAVADSGFRFVKWSDGVKDSARADASARRDSTVAAIFEEAPVIAVKSSDRIVPIGRLPGETSRIQPVKIIARGFAAGPNPVLRQSGTVNFYWQGAAVVEGTLLIFDAVGNFVSKIGVNGINKRNIAAWNLTGADGKPVGVGTYLVKGTLLTKSGTREKVVLTLILI